MVEPISTERVQANPQTSTVNGHVTWLPIKSAWVLMHGTLGLVGLFMFPQADGAVAFLILTAITICAGHSVGMHRLLIHRSFETPRYLEYLLVWLGVLVGMAGPFGMIRAHDMRDWHQRQTHCPPHPSHAAPFFKDAWWQLCCEFRLSSPPRFEIEDSVSSDRFYRILERTWMLQQVPLAVLLFALGGWAWVLWGCSLRILVSLVGHWMIGHFAHKRGHQGWRIEGLPVQGYNLPGFGLLTFGENWHGNHHAFPHSAKLGLELGQSDPGFLLITALEQVGLASNIQMPGSAPERAGLRRLSSSEPSHKS